jgi:hypothetical protein
MPCLYLCLLSLFILSRVVCFVLVFEGEEEGCVLCCVGHTRSNMSGTSGSRPPGTSVTDRLSPTPSGRVSPAPLPAVPFAASSSLRERQLRVGVPDAVFYLHAERRYAKSDLLYKTMLKLGRSGSGVL